MTLKILTLRIWHWIATSRISKSLLYLVTLRYLNLKLLFDLRKSFWFLSIIFAIIWWFPSFWNSHVNLAASYRNLFKLNLVFWSTAEKCFTKSLSYWTIKSESISKLLTLIFTKTPTGETDRRQIMSQTWHQVTLTNHNNSIMNRKRTLL